ncbi:MAG: PAS domain S-box protein [Leptolyngbyaceae cyanobacterium MO_188.B28]|nr:PAS domain S-box protein [Leptolyngbyaceae cyanobacterium MO_188.B28]
MFAAHLDPKHIKFILGSYVAPTGAALLFLLLWAKSNVINENQHNQYLDTLYRLQELDTRINNNVLQAEIGGLSSYDPIVNQLSELKRVRKTLDQVPPYIESAAQQKLTQLFTPYSRVWGKKEKLIYRFKSQNAILRNSQAYFPIAIADLTQKNTANLASIPRLNSLLQKVLLFNQSIDKNLAKEIERDIQQILADPGLAAQGEDLENAIAHARIILQYRPQVDALVSDIVTPPTGAWSEEFIRTYNHAYQKSLNSGARYRFGLYLLFFVWVLGTAGAIILKLQAYAKALQKSEIKFRNIFENSQMGIFRVKEKNGSILEANQRFLDMFGYDSATDLIGIKHLPEFYADPEQSKAMLQILQAKGEVQHFETQFQRRDGEVFWGLCSSRLNRREHCLEGVIADISARKQAEAELEAQRAFLNQIIDVVPSAIFVKTVEGLFFTVNKAGAAMYRSTVKGILGRSEADFIKDPAQRNELADIHQKVMATRQTQIVPTQMLKDSRGELRCYQTIISPFMNSDKQVQGTIGASTDITPLKQAEDELRRAKEAAEAANKAKSTFLANMSHELRTPLNAILGFSQLMTRSGELNPKQHNYLSTISRSGEHLLMLINDVLEMSKVEAGKTTLNENNFELYGLLDGLQAMFQLKAESKGLQLNCDRAPHVPQYIRTDEVKLRQVLVNLLGNAIKFTQKGRVTLRVRTGDRGLQSQDLGVRNQESGVRSQESGVAGQRVEESGELTVRTKFPPKRQILQTEFTRQGGDESGELTVRTGPTSDRQILLFEVEDTGPGISAEEIPRLFEPFAQTDAGRQAQEGTGLGLPISRKFVQLLGGSLAVESRLGEGSMFRFDIQAQVVGVNQVPMADRDRQIRGLAAGEPRYRILVTEDKPENQQLLVELLEPVGFEVQLAANGQEAISRCQQWSPHLIWMDLRMPVMDGYEATHRIKSTYAHPPVIIALTGSAFEEEIQIALSKGCDDFVRKPFRTEEIFEKMAEHLGVRYAYAESAQSLVQTPQATSNTDNRELSAASFEGMPAAWIEEVHQAATKVNAKLIRQLSEQIPPSYGSIAQALIHLADNFRFEEIVALTQSRNKSDNAHPTPPN